MGQRLMRAATDIFLGWQPIKCFDGVARDYYVRQFHDWKGDADVERMRGFGAIVYAQVRGATLARAHARWGDRDRDRLLPRPKRYLRPGHRRLRRLRRPERTGPPGIRRRRDRRKAHCANRAITGCGTCPDPLKSAGRRPAQAVRLVGAARDSNAVLAKATGRLAHRHRSRLARCASASNSRPPAFSSSGAVVRFHIPN